MKKTMFLLVLGLIVFTGCKNRENEILNEITVSDKSVSFEKIAGKKEITVTSDESWAVTVNDSWIKTTQEKNKLVLEVTENLIDTERKGTIFIMARGVEPIAVDVKQAAGDTPFSFSPTSISFKADGGSETVEITTTATGKLMVTSSEKWLHAESVDGKVVISAIANDTEKSRSAIVKVKVGEILKDIKVDQEAPLLYVVPMLPFGESIDFVSVNSFETKRGSVMEKSSENLQNRTKIFVYRPMCKKIPVIHYVFRSAPIFGESLTTVLSYLDSKNGWDGYEDVLKSNGLNYIYTDKYSKNMIYSKEDNKRFVSMKLADHAKYGVVTSLFEATDALAQEPKQTTDYPTFAEVPYGFGEFNVGLEAVDKWEKENGGSDFTEQLHPSFPVLIREYKVKEDENQKVISRMYFFFIDKVEDKKEYFLFQQTYIYNTVELALYIDANKSCYPTKEFNNLISKDGFEFSKVVGDNLAAKYTFVSAPKSTQFTIMLTEGHLAISSSSYTQKASSSSFNKYTNMSFDERVKAHLNESSSNETASYKGIEIKLK